MRSVAGVPPAEAVSVDNVVTPRATANRVTDAVAQQALYATMTGRVYAVAPPVAATGNTSLFERARAVRRPRPFDPDRRPAPLRATDAIADPEETAALREKAQQGHHDLLVCLDRELAAAGWGAVEEIPSAIDLRATTPAGVNVIFEAKTIAGSNETEQARSALAQLLEYRQEYGHPEDGICVVVDVALSERRVDVLGRLGVGVVVATANGIRTQNDVAVALLAG